MSKVIKKEIRYLLSNGMILRISTKSFKRKFKSGWKSVVDTTGIIEGFEDQGYFWLEKDGEAQVISGSFNTSVIENIFEKYSNEIEKCFLKYYAE